ncbi:hypothetical protein NDU88_008052, partial [Pleurodeles waltl]
KLQGKISGFSWASKGVRISWKKLRRKKEKGGLAAPDMQYYAWAYLLKKVRQSFNALDHSELGQVLIAMMEGQEIQRS